MLISIKPCKCHKSMKAAAQQKKWCFQRNRKRSSSLISTASLTQLTTSMRKLPWRTMLMSLTLLCQESRSISSRRASSSTFLESMYWKQCHPSITSLWVIGHSWWSLARPATSSPYHYYHSVWWLSCRTPKLSGPSYLGSLSTANHFLRSSLSVSSLASAESWWWHCLAIITIKQIFPRKARTRHKSTDLVESSAS